MKGDEHLTIWETKSKSAELPTFITYCTKEHTKGPVILRLHFSFS